MMIETSIFEVGRVRDLRTGSFARIIGVDAPVFKFEIADGQADDNALTEGFFCDLGGDQSFEVWRAGDLPRYLASSVSALRVAVDWDTGEAAQGVYGHVGKVFKTASDVGLIANVPHGRGLARGQIAISISGSPAQLQAGEEFIVFSKWKLECGAVDNPILLFEAG